HVLPVCRARAPSGEIADEKVILQIVERHWLAVAFKIAGFGAIDLFQHGDPSRDEARVTELSAADDAIDALLYQIDQAIRHSDLEQNARLARMEFRKRGHNDAPPQRTRHVDFQFAFRVVDGVREARFDFFQLAQQTDAALV